MKTSFKFTDSAIAKLPANPADSPSKAKEYSDSQCPGLKLAVGKAVKGKLPHKSWLYRGTLKGKKICLNLGNAQILSVAEARAKAIERMSLIEQGIDPRVKIELEEKPAVLTFAQLSSQYMELSRQTKRSAHDDQSKLTHHLLPRWGSRPIDSFTRRDVELYHLEILAKLSPATANRHLSLVSSLFKKAVDWDLLSKNPAKGIQKAKENNVITTHLKEDEIIKFFNALDQDANAVASCALKFLTVTGLRSQEALQAKWVNVDWEHATLFLPHTKSGKSRHVPLNEVALSILQAMKKVRHGEYVFPGKDPSKPYCNIKKPLQRALKEAGLASIRPHDLRHTFASLLVSKNVSLYLVKDLLGHASPSVTQKYAHTAPSAVREASQMISALVGFSPAPDSVEPTALAI